MEKPVIAQNETDPNQITQTVQNGVLIIKKRQTDPDEVLFYNTDYFKRIGFPEIEVSLVPVTVPKTEISFEDKSSLDNPPFTERGHNESESVVNVAKGGYYKHPEKLTFPFRHFVFLIQRDKPSQEQEEDQENEQEENTKSQKYTFENPVYGLFERLVKYRNSISNKLQSGIFAKSTVQTEKTQLEPDVQNEPVTQEESVKEQKDPGVEENETQYFWVLRIPIIKSDEEIVPLGKYEKMEIRLEQIIRDEKVDKSLGKSKEVEEIMVNGRVLRLCKRVKEWSPVKYEMEEELKGSKMFKMKLND